MSRSNPPAGHRKRMAIITSYFSDETYGILGPQMAATIIQDHTDYECIVIGVTREDNVDYIQIALNKYFLDQLPVVGFSCLSGGQKLYNLAGTLKQEGAVTILAGPQADVDFKGEVDREKHPHRFKGYSEKFTFALHGPAEQAIHLLNHLNNDKWQETPGLLYLDDAGNIVQNPKTDWDEKFLQKINWKNIYVLKQDQLVPLIIQMGQILQHLGCPHASRKKQINVNYPTHFENKQGRTIKISFRGCSFCDVATDKGFHGKLSMETVIRQIICLPENSEGKKIPFELINEKPLFDLPDLLIKTDQQGIRLSQISLILRADWFISGIVHMKEALKIAEKLGVHILISSIGFEAFDNTLLKNMNKGVTVEKNLEAIRLLRKMKQEFPRHMAYSRQEGAIHGLIHPTPWDNAKISSETQKNMAIYSLQHDILPPHSTPLIIHHASGLGEWIREIEKREEVLYKRLGSIIAWWDGPEAR